MTVTAKFKVEAVTQHAWSQHAKTVKLSAVAGEENKPWSEYTPSGTIELQITNPAAHSQFALGKTFLLTFEEA